MADDSDPQPVVDDEADPPQPRQVQRPGQRLIITPLPEPPPPPCCCLCPGSAA
ncbi:MAG: hypothetical protein ACRERC_00770 [Candidatus Binatia bacterium]